MAKPLIVTDGKDPLTSLALWYLDRAYGIPPGDVRAVRVNSEIGQALTIEVTLLVDRDKLND